MKDILKQSLLFAVALLLFAACSDWTKVESIDIKETMPWESNPAGWEDYQARVRGYKARPHKLTYIRFANSPEGVLNEKGSLRSLPDSLDIVSLTNGENFSGYDAEDIARMKAVDIKLLYQIELVKSENPAAAIDKAVSIVSKYSLDGFSFTAPGSESASAVLDRLMAAKTEAQMIVFEGDPGILSPSDIDRIDLFVLATQAIETDFDLRNYLGDVLEAGVPLDKMLLSVSTQGAFRNIENAELPVLEAMADRVVNYGPMAGLALFDIESDYYHYDMNWSSLRSVIHRLNP